MTTNIDKMMTPRGNGNEEETLRKEDKTAQRKSFVTADKRTTGFVKARKTTLHKGGVQDR